MIQKIKAWYELFLIFFVLFWNLEYIHRGANDYVKSKKGTVSCIAVLHIYAQY